MAAIAGLTCAFAVGFHAGAEAILSLRIGWFTNYMLLIAAIGLLPSGWLHSATAPALRAAAWLDVRLAGADGPKGRWLGAGALAAAALAAAGVGVALELPGAPAAGVAAAAATVAAAVGPTSLGRRGPSSDRRRRRGRAGRGRDGHRGRGLGRAAGVLHVGRPPSSRRVRRPDRRHDAYERAGRYGSPRLDGLWTRGAAGSG